MKYLDLIALLNDSPMPWTSGMLADWFGCDKSGITRCASQGYIASAGRGLYTAKGRIRRKNPIQERLRLLRGATFSPRGHDDVITDDMLARFGFNL